MPASPPLDARGIIIPHDHDEILDEYNVVRHITPNDLHQEPDGRKRIASGAFSESSDEAGGMSVDIQQWMEAEGLDILTYVKSSDYGAVALNVGKLRQEGFMVGWDPLPHNRHHGAVWGNFNGSKAKRKIARIAVTIRKAKGES